MRPAPSARHESGRGFCEGSEREGESHGGNVTGLKLECKDRLRLLGEYDAAIVAASLAQASLSATNATEPDYRIIRLAQNTAAVRLNNARTAYERHIIEHGCTLERAIQ